MKPRTKKIARQASRAGRKPAYGDALRKAITVRFDEEQAAAVEAWCVRHDVSPATLVREAALQRAGAARLGNGIRTGSATREVKMAGPCSIPIKLNDSQHAAIVLHCAASQIQPGVFLREATLGHVGAGHLGASQQIEALARVVGAAQ